MTWGYHLIANFKGCKLSKIVDAANIAAFTKQLVHDIDMVAYGKPQIVNFGTGNKAGYTLIQLIETSNIAAHFCNENGDVYLDVFSCKSFDPKIALGVFKNYFLPTGVNFQFITRQA